MNITYKRLLEALPIDPADPRWKPFKDAVYEFGDRYDPRAPYAQELGSAWADGFEWALDMVIASPELAGVVAKVSVDGLNEIFDGYKDDDRVWRMLFRHRLISRMAEAVGLEADGEAYSQLGEAERE